MLLLGKRYFIIYDSVYSFYFEMLFGLIICLSLSIAKY